MIWLIWLSLNSVRFYVILLVSNVGSFWLMIKKTHIPHPASIAFWPLCLAPWKFTETGKRHNPSSRTGLWKWKWKGENIMKNEEKKSPNWEGRWGWLWKWKWKGENIIRNEKKVTGLGRQMGLTVSENTTCSWKTLVCNLFKCVSISCTNSRRSLINWHFLIFTRSVSLDPQ